MASIFSRHAPFAALVLTSIAPLTSGTRVVFSGLFDAGIVDFTPRDGTLKNGSQHVEGIFDARSSASISIASDLGEAATSIQGGSATTRNASATSADPEPICKKDDTGLAVGCHLNCHCGWGQQCYPKWLPPEDPHHHPSKQAPSGRENRGVCQTAMPVLALASFIIFSVVLTTFVGVRTFLQWRALEDDHDAQFFIKTLSTNASKSCAHVGKVNSLSGVLQKSAPQPGASAETDPEDSDGGDDAPARAKLEAGKAAKVEGPVAAAACDEEDTEKF